MNSTSNSRKRLSCVSRFVAAISFVLSFVMVTTNTAYAATTVIECPTTITGPCPSVYSIAETWTELYNGNDLAIEVQPGSFHAASGSFWWQQNGTGTWQQADAGQWYDVTPSLTGITQPGPSGHCDPESWGSNSHGIQNVTSNGWVTGHTYCIFPTVGPTTHLFRINYCNSGVVPSMSLTNYTWPSGCGSVPQPAWCATTDYSGAVGSWDGTTLAVRFKWLNSTKPSAGWSVIAPDPGASTGSTFTVPTTATVDGSPGVYYAKSAVSTLSTMTARIYAAANGAAPGCYVSITLSGNAISQTPTSTPDGSTITDPTGGTQHNTHCHWSLNPVDYFLCLFEPDSSLQQWNDLKTTAQTHPPISLIYGGIGYIQTGINAFNSSTAGCGISGSAVPSCAYTFDGPDGYGHANLIQAACDYMTGCTSDHATGTVWGQIVYYLLEAGIAGFFFWRIWAIIAAAVGTKAVSE